MKIFGVLMILLFPLLSFGQFSLAAQAGATYTTPHLSKQSVDIHVKGGIGWQAGVSAAYQVHKLFFYSGLNAVKYRFSQSEGDWTYNRYTFQPIYLQVPAGIGYKFSLHNNKSLSLYGGVQGLLGIAGKFEQPQYIICVMAPCPQPKERTTSDIDFGKEDYTSFAKTAANLQAGATVTLTEHLSAGVFYAWSISDVKSLSNPYTGSTHLRIWDVSVKYNLVK